MKKTYLILSVIGFILPNIWVTKVTLETGNFMLYAHPMETMRQMFANDISSIFAIDLFFAVAVFMIFSYHQAQKHGIDMKKIVLTWVLTFAFGLAGGFPFFLYVREKELIERGAGN